MTVPEPSAYRDFREFRTRARMGMQFLRTVKTAETLPYNWLSKAAHDAMEDSKSLREEVQQISETLEKYHAALAKFAV